MPLDVFGITEPIMVAKLTQVLERMNRSGGNDTIVGVPGVIDHGHSFLQLARRASQRLPFLTRIAEKGLS
jgi:hypothetical protein